MRRTDSNWSIGIYSGPTPLALAAPEEPALRARDVTDIDACFVADPFMQFDGARWSMFLGSTLRLVKESGGSVAPRFASRHVRSTSENDATSLY